MKEEILNNLILSVITVIGYYLLEALTVSQLSAESEHLELSLGFANFNFYPLSQFTEALQNYNKKS
jgi:hypothetical protein